MKMTPLGRPHQIHGMLTAEDRHGRTILTAAVSSKNVDTFRAVFYTAKKTLNRKLVRRVNGGAASKNTVRSAALL